MNKILGHFYLPFFKKKKICKVLCLGFLVTKYILAFGVTLQGSFLSLSSV